MKYNNKRPKIIKKIALEISKYINGSPNLLLVAKENRETRETFRYYLARKKGRTQIVSKPKKAEISKYLDFIVNKEDREFVSKLL